MFQRAFGIFLLFISTTVFAAPIINETTLQQLAYEYLKKHRIDEHISAIAITLQDPKNQAPISVYAGYTSYDNQKLIRSDNTFQIGSITKSFTSAIILQLENDRNLNFSIQDSIEKFFPQYKNWKGITVKQLMNMTSGIPDYSTSHDFAIDLISNPYRHRTSDELINYSYKLPIHFQPGFKYEYSNANYILLGMIIEKLTGNSLAYEMKNRLIEPLKLNHTYFTTNKIDDSAYQNLVRGYSYKKESNDYIPMGTDVTDFSMSIYGAAGGIISNASDITQWVNALFTPGKILSKEQLQKLTQLVSTKTGKLLEVPTKDDPDGYGLGITYTYLTDSDELVYGYEGMTLAGRAFYIYIPTRDIIISATVNSSVDDSGDNSDHLEELVMNVYKSLIER